MADSILRLKVESQEYDNKIKRAAEGIQQYAQKCRDAGGTLEHLDDGVEEFVRALGQMDTVSKSAKGSVNELTRAFTDLSVQYNRLTDEEKQSPFGKALSSSLDELKGRIQSGNAEIKNIGESLNGGGGLKDALDAVAGKFGLNIGQLTKFGGALAAAKTALDTVKGAIESTEATHDALARTISVTDNVTNQFLRSLATADFSNFINGLQSIIDKTIDAYNAMDEFESYAARFQPWQQAKESQIQTKIMQARAAKAKGENDRAEQLNNEAKQLIQELAKSTKAYGEKQTTGGFATIRSLMGQVNISNQQIAWYADPKNWETAKRKAEEYARIQERIKKGNMMSSGAEAHADAQRAQELLNRDPSLLRAYTMQNLRDSGDSKQAQQFRQALGNIYGNTLAESRIESLMARADRMEGMLTRAGGGGGGGGKGGNAEVVAITGSIDEQTKKVQELQKAWRAAADDDSREKIKKQIEEQQYVLDRMTGKETFDESRLKQIQSMSIAPKMEIKPLDAAPLKQQIQVELQAEAVKVDQATLKTLMQDAIQSGINTMDLQFASLSKQLGDGIEVPQEKWDAILERYNDLREQIGLEPIKINFETGGIEKVNDGAKGTAKSMTTAAQAINSVGSALNSIEDPTARIVALVAQGIAAVVSAAGIATEKAAGQSRHWGEYIAAAASITAQMITIISQMHSASGYERGGIIKGNSYSGDNIGGIVDGSQFVGLNAGEVVLNASQQSMLASNLQGSGGGGYMPSHISGEQIWIAINRYTKRTGQGEVVTWK